MFAAACEGFRRVPTEDFRKDVAEHVRDGVLYVIIKDSKAVGFAVFKDYPELKTTYISGIVKGSGTPSGIVEKIVARHVSNFETAVVRTQNDRVVEIMKGVCREVIPIRREADEKDLDILKQTKLFSPKMSSDLVVHGHYSGSPMIGEGERRRSQDEEVRKTTDRLDYEKGDALILIGFIGCYNNEVTT